MVEKALKLNKNKQNELLKIFITEKVFVFLTC
ncbi:MAG: hypothetical protein IEMM0006_1932 [bacterium]|nr:MAG: hypothetical protein IEMM0006_1932 [bacterium]